VQRSSANRNSDTWVTVLISIYVNLAFDFDWPAASSILLVSIINLFPTKAKGS
jgi:hypothetical protein